MLRREVKASLLPFYGGLNTVPDFSRVATSFALIRKAIAEIRKLEDFFLGGQITDKEYKQGLREMAIFANIITEQADKALVVVTDIRKKVAVYEGELADVLG